MTEPTRIFLGLKKFLSEHIFKFTGNVDIVNFPKIQQVEVVNQQEQKDGISINNIKEVTDPLTKSLMMVRDEIKKISTPDNKEVLRVLERLIVAVEEKSIPEVDLSGVLKKLDEETKINIDLKLL